MTSENDTSVPGNESLIMNNIKIETNIVNDKLTPILSDRHLLHMLHAACHFPSDTVKFLKPNFTACGLYCALSVVAGETVIHAIAMSIRVTNRWPSSVVPSSLLES